MVCCYPLVFFDYLRDAKVVRISAALLFACGVAGRRVRAGISMLRVTTFLRPTRLRFCSTTIVRDMVTREQKSPDGMNQMRRGSNALLITNAPYNTACCKLGNTELSRKIVG